MKMKLDYAQGFITQGYAGHWRTVSCHDNLLVIEDLEDYENVGYLGTHLDSDRLVADAEDYVHFTRVKPVIDENTRFSL